MNRCYCPKCDKKETCIHAEAFRRLPKSEGGLALCPKLKDDTDPKNPRYCIFENKICIYADNKGQAFQCTAPSDDAMLCKK